MPAEYFVELYRREADPWNFSGSEYEHRKYAQTLASLPRARYAGALEIACSIGVFTGMLAERCERLLAVDVSADALERARTACASHKHVRFERRVMPAEFPPGAFDLVTVCEMGFYLDRADLLALRDRIVAATMPGADIVLVHWTPHVDGHATEALDVHRIFRETPELRHVSGYSSETYRLDVLERR